MSDMTAPANTKFFLHNRSGYTKHKCRCDICRTAYSDYQRAYRDRVKANFRPKRHGTQWNYNMGCRCTACRAAKRWSRGKLPVEAPE